jgi:polysaccharide pyruvyl transferase WcaK-like protein
MMEHLDFDFVLLLDETAAFRKVKVLPSILSPLCVLDNTVVWQGSEAQLMTGRYCIHCLGGSCGRDFTLYTWRIDNL